jgi:hypothetical protein
VQAPLWLRNLFTPQKAALAASIATVVSAVLAGLALAQNQWLDDAEEKNGRLDDRNTALSDRVDELVSENAGLREDVANVTGANEQLRDDKAELSARVLELERQLQPLPEDVDAPRIRKAQTLTLRVDGQAIDLNSTGVNFDAGPDGQGEDDFAYVASSIFSPKQLLQVGSGDFARIAQGPAQYETCSLATNYDVDAGSIPLRDLRDDLVCIRLESGRIATVLVKDFDDEEATMKVTVWDLP